MWRNWSKWIEKRQWIIKSDLRALKLPKCFSCYINIIFYNVKMILITDSKRTFEIIRIRLANQRLVDHGTRFIVTNKSIIILINTMIWVLASKFKCEFKYDLVWVFQSWLQIEDKERFWEHFLI